jgi:sodium transport system ATP-binding protein
MGERGHVVNALNDLSFACSPGRIHALLGTNGSGKSTCLRILSGLLEPTSGQVIIENRNLSEHSSWVKKRIGYVSIATQTYDRLTVSEFVLYFGRLHNVRADLLTDRINTLFDRLQIGVYRDRLCGSLSNGMKQRASLARALIHDPDVILFDEPFNGLDVLGNRALGTILMECRQNGKTVLFTANGTKEPQWLSDHIFLLHRGYMIENAPLKDLTEKYEEQVLDKIILKALSHGHEHK